MGSFLFIIIWLSTDFFVFCFFATVLLESTFLVYGCL